MSYLGEVPTVKVTLKLTCGCTEALVEDGPWLVYCSADVCRGRWFCQCVDGQVDPEVCDHAEALLLVMGMV